MKKTVSFLLAVIFSLTAFGGMSIFSGVMGAGAEFYDYFNYVSIPAFDAFTPDGIKGQVNYYSDFVGFTDDVLPEGDVVDHVATFKATHVSEWNDAIIRSFKKRSTPEGNTDHSANWSANGYIDDKDIFGDTGLTFEGASGITFWLTVDGEVFNNKITFMLHQVPARGPYYTVSDDTGEQDMMDMPEGAVYAAKKYADQDGYYYFDFKTDFCQEDWWSVDDDGINQWQKGNTPIPKSKLPILNGFQIVCQNTHANAIIRVGDFRICYDSRVHLDELDEYISIFDSLDPESYTEESFEQASEAYLAAYEVYLDPQSQMQVDNAVTSLRRAIAALKPLFHAKDKNVTLAGFEVWDEAELDQTSEIGLDTAVISTEIAPANKEQSVMIMANATAEAPTYGYSWFTNGSEEGAIDNPFALAEGSSPLSETSGIRFWLKWDESFENIPEFGKIGVGSSTSGVYFECEDSSVKLPESEGYVGIPWSAFYDINGEYEIYDYIDELDYISIYIFEATGIYYIADLHAFVWDISSADFEPLERKINDTYSYMATLNENDWYYQSWERVEAAIVNAEALVGKYGATEEEVQAAIDAIDAMVAKLMPIRDLATPPTIAKLTFVYQVGKNIWRGNVSPTSYRVMAEQLSIAEMLIAEGPSEEAAQAAIAELDAAIDALIPIKAGEKVTSIHSFENYNLREFNRATGDRTEGVLYSLANASDVPGIPEGYAKALKMVATKDMSADNSDEHGVMQFKAMKRESGVTPILLGPNNENLLIGDLTGTDGICLWIGVNDVNLVQECTLRFAVSNCTKAPLFERAARDIPLPSTGSGWLYIPWEYFEFYDEWTNGEPIRLNEIYFYILRFNGLVKEGLEVYATGIHAYKNTVAGEWEAPVIENITDGSTVDISGNSLIPKWSAGTAALDGEYFIYGNSVVTNGEHTLEVRNGNKSTSITFTVTGGKDKEYSVPIVYGVENGGEYSSAVTPTWDVGTATLNDKVFAKGDTVSEVGEYILVVTNGDKQTTVSFTIKEPEMPVVSGVEDGGEYTSVAITWNVGTATLNGEAVESGVNIVGVGEYTLIVTNGTKSVTVNFKIIEKPANDKGDFDGDGELTVADALAALRIAARMAESSDEAIAIGDIDADGEITVADALAILRVAARMADSL